MSGSNSISQAQLRDLFDYADGRLLWRISRQRIQRGAAAGCVGRDGRIRVGIDGKLYLLHRLIWAWHHGPLGAMEIDHINCDHTDNRIENLRLATRSQNNANKTAKSNNTSGYKGVTFHRKANKWSAAITYENKTTYLGLFDSKELAHECYALAADMIHGHFARA